MTDLAPTAAEVDPSGDPAQAFIIRAATVYLAVDHDAPPATETAPRLAEALEDDPRVRFAHVEPPDKDWSPSQTVYSPAVTPGDDDGVLEATRHVHIQRLSHPVEFMLDVPEKNQPKVFEDSRIPSEIYRGLWDGVTLLIGWEQPTTEYVGASGGHVVESVLEEAAQRIDADILVQACNRECRYVFVHTEVRVVPDKDAAADWSIVRDPHDPSVLNATIGFRDGSRPDLSDALFEAWFNVGSSLDRFADLKNTGRQILDLEAVVRWDLDRLNRLHHDRASASQEKLVARLKATWQYRSWRRTSRFYLSRLWRGLGNLEHLKRTWTKNRLAFERMAREEQTEMLFQTDTHDELPLIEALDLHLIESAIEHAGDRLSNNALVLATAGGAVAGAIVAALITLL